MIDPADQLRRLAEARADQVEPFTPDELERPDAEASGGVVLPFIARRWPAAVAAALLAIVALGAATFATFGGSSGDDPQFVADGGLDTETPSTVLDEVVVPDVVGLDADEAAAELAELGLDPTFDVLFVAPGDDRLDRVTAMSLPDGLPVPKGESIELQVARLAPTALATDACQRPAHLVGTFDDDRLLDAVHPRFENNTITELEVCTAAGARPVAYDLGFHRIGGVVDLDVDGVDEIVGPLDEGETVWRVLAMNDGGEVVLVDGNLAFGPRVGGEVNDWWGCHAFAASGLERLAVGTWTTAEDGSVEWEVVQWDIVGDQVVTGEADHGTEPPGSDGPPGRARCEDPRPDPAPSCGITDLEVAVVGDLDGDGEDDWVSPRDDLVCWGDGLLRSIGPAAATAEIWFLDDIEDDGQLELFLGTTTYGSTAAQPYALNENRGFVPVAGPDCCVQDLPRQILEVNNADFVGRWFSCVAATEELPAGLVAGRFWHNDDGTVEWTIDTGPGADAEVVRVASVGDPRSVDAWRPGNGCQGTAPVWMPPVSIAFADDGTVDPASVAAFNEWTRRDDPDRRHVRLREALGIADMLGAGEVFWEDVNAGTIDVSGWRDDSVAAVRFSITWDDAELVSIERLWSCQPDRGQQDFATERCA